MKKVLLVLVGLTLVSYADTNVTVEDINISEVKVEIKDSPYGKENIEVKAVKENIEIVTVKKVLKPKIDDLSKEFNEQNNITMKFAD